MCSITARSSPCTTHLTPLYEKAREPEVCRTSSRLTCKWLLFAILEPVNGRYTRFSAAQGDSSLRVSLPRSIAVHVATVRAQARPRKHDRAADTSSHPRGLSQSCICAWCHGEEPALGQAYSDGSHANEGDTYGRADETGPCRGCAAAAFGSSAGKLMHIMHNPHAMPVLSLRIGGSP